MSPADGQHSPDRLDALEPEQVAAFRAFRRPQNLADQAFLHDNSAASASRSHLNPDLARRVYDGVEGTINLVPGRNTICCVVIVAGTGEMISGSTSTELAARGAHGFSSSGPGRSATFRGVLAVSVRDLRIVTASEAITVPVNSDDAYWITITDPIDMILTLTDGTERHIPEPPRGQP
jgi:hypothetical protein